MKSRKSCWRASGVRLLACAVVAAVSSLGMSARVLASVPHFTTASASAPQDYGDYSLMFSRSAGQYFAGAQVAGQWAWRPVSATVSDVSWGDPSTWPPASAERFVRSGNWVELDGYSNGQGQPLTEIQRVTSEEIGGASCQDMRPLHPDGGREHYVMWNIPSAGYCLEAAGTITSTANGSVVHFEHKQQWSPPAPCSNSYLSGQTCISQHEQWFDDNGHSFRLVLDRTQDIARGLGMAFEIRQTYPISWSADGRYYWSW